MTLANSSFILANLTSDSVTDTPNARKLAVVSGLLLTNNGPQGTLVIGLQGALNSLQNPTSSNVGFPSYNNSTGVYLNRTLIGGTGMQITYGDGVMGNPTFNVIPGSVLQKVKVGKFGSAPLNSYSYLQFAASGGLDVSVTDVGLGDSAKITFTGEGLGSVTSVGVDSSTGLLVSGSPVTTSGTIDVNLPGSGGSHALVKGDMLYADSGVYTALAIGTNGQIMTILSGVPAWTDNVGIINVSMTSSSGIVLTNASPITSNTTVTINLPGTDGGAVAVGDMLIGGAGAVYTAVAIGTNGQVWTSDGTTASWVTPTADTPWYQTPNPTGGSGANVSMGNHAWLDTAYYEVNQGEMSGSPASGKGWFGAVEGSGNTYPAFQSNIGTQYIVTAETAGYGATNSVLVGNAVDYTALAAPTAGQLLVFDTTSANVHWGPTVAPTEGQVVGYSGGEIQWIDNTVNVLPSGIVAFNAKTPSDQFTNYWYAFIADANLTADSVIVACGIQVYGTAYDTPAAGCFVINDYSNALGNGVGFYIVSPTSGGEGDSATYQIVKY